MKRKLLFTLVLVVLVAFVLAAPTLAHDGVGGDEYAAADIMLIFAAGMGALSVIGLLFSFSLGEFRHPERAKYVMLERALVDEDGEEVDKYATTEVQY